ncbi:MAG TPA: tRNA (N6-isopentenyl adenosine(37)-C2)-methylthiotransferase MiaB [Actinomycetota bacterium]|nr:tRNA (N6-isopentenyl adenosine(37)-C2)-methylthiotransferase MiaB [Actinomycetota bacterium]
MRKTYFIRTYGCQMNEHDSERIAGLLEMNGYVRAPDPDTADLVLFNTCAIRENADNRLYGTLGHMKALKDRRPDLRIAVGGCQAQKDKELVLEKAPWVDVAFGTFSVAELPRLLVDRERSGVPAFDFAEQTETFPSALPARRADPFHAWVSVSVGCDNACTFCIVPHVRGPQVSRRMGDVLDEVRRLVDDGVVEVSLLGQNVNTYGRDLDGTPLFADLLRALDEVEGLRRVRFTSPHPHDFTPDVIDAMASSRVVCEHIHFPLQSGSDRVLARMRRSYRSARYLEKLASIREAIPDIAVSTDVIVGFPGETEDDFDETLRVVEEGRFDSAYTFKYSIRPHTEAGTMPDQVPAQVAGERYERLVDLQERISLERNGETVGRSYEVLVEGTSKKDPSRVTARTRTNKIVHVPADGLRPGMFETARVTHAHPHHLDGVLA